MQKITTTVELEEKIFEYKKNNKTIGFVPTMGALHEGHLSLVRIAKKKSDIVVVSVFINPTQFTNAYDLSIYPRDTDIDCDLLLAEGVDIVFFPEAKDVYQPGKFLEKENIHLPEKFLWEEGATRPGHFEGVYQVLHRFFSILQPDRVVFGQKDYQQILLVQYLLAQEFPPIGGPFGEKIFLEVGKIFREKSGLAMSSRNKNLTCDEKEKAALLSTIVQKMQNNFLSGETSAEQFLAEAKFLLAQEPLVQKISTLCIRDTHTFEEKNIVEEGDVFLIAVTFAGVHLLDNGIMGEKDM